MSLDPRTGLPEPQPLRLKIKKLHPNAVVPQYATPGAACFDLHALPGDYLSRAIGPGDKSTFRTGLSFEVPKGHVMLVFSRSGHGFKNDIRLANCVGVIDSDYRGEVMVKLTCDDENPLLMPNDLAATAADKSYLVINAGDRIAQAMLVPIPQVELVEVDELSDTERGAGGFGSTGA